MDKLTDEQLREQELQKFIDFMEGNGACGGAWNRAIRIALTTLLALRAERAKLEAALGDAFNALGGMDGQVELRDRILPLLSQPAESGATGWTAEQVLAGLEKDGGFGGVVAPPRAGAKP